MSPSRGDVRSHCNRGKSRNLLEGGARKGVNVAMEPVSIISAGGRPMGDFRVRGDARVNIRANVEVERSGARVTPSPAGRRFREALSEAGNALLNGVETVGGLIGSPVASAAVRGGLGAAGGALSEGGGAGGGESAEAPGGSVAGAGSSANDTVSEALRANRNEAMKFLELQQRISAENRRYTALSNVMKARHETAKSAINNIR